MEKIALINTSQGGGATTYALDTLRFSYIFGSNPRASGIVRLLFQRYTMSGNDADSIFAVTPVPFACNEMWVYISKADVGGVLRITFPLSGNIYNVTCTTGAGYYGLTIAEEFLRNERISFEAFNVDSTTDIILTSWSFVINEILL